MDHKTRGSVQDALRSGDTETRIAAIDERIHGLRQFATAAVGLSAAKVHALLQTLQAEVVDDSFAELSQDQIAARGFPDAAKANPQIFYSNGHSRTIREVYKALVAQQGGIVAADVQPDSKFTSQQMAAASSRTGPGDGSAQQAPTDEVPSRFSKADMSFTALFSTEAPTGVPMPLIGAEAAAPLIASQGAPPIDPAQGAQPLALMDPAAAIPSAPLAAIDSAMSGTPDSGPAEIGDPFAAPAPLAGLGAATAPQPLALMGDGGTQASGLPLLLPPDSPVPQAATANDVPQPRVLMSPGPHVPNSAFFTQVLAQQAPYQGVNE